MSHLTSSNAIFLSIKTGDLQTITTFSPKNCYTKYSKYFIHRWKIGLKRGGENILFLVFKGSSGRMVGKCTQIPQSSIRRLPLQSFEPTEQYILMQNMHRLRKNTQKEFFFLEAKSLFPSMFDTRWSWEETAPPRPLRDSQSWLSNLCRVGRGGVTDDGGRWFWYIVRTHNIIIGKRMAKIVG